MLLTDNINEPFVKSICNNMLSTLKFGLQQQTVNKNTKLTPNDKMFLDDLLENTDIVKNTQKFLEDLNQFKAFHIPQFILFLTNQVNLLDNKKVAYNTLECIKFLAHTILSSNTVNMNPRDLAIWNAVVDSSIILLETNLEKPNSRGCFYFF